MLRVLANVLALPGFDYESSEQVRDEFIPGGTVFINHTDNGVDLPLSPIISPVGNGLERIADVPIYFSDALVRRSPALQQTKDAEEPLAYLHPETLSALAVDAQEVDIESDKSRHICSSACYGRHRTRRSSRCKPSDGRNTGEMFG